MKHKPSNVIKLLALIFLVLALGTDLVFEIFGLPGIVRHAVQNELEAAGIAADAGKIRGGIFTGINMENLTVWDGQRAGTRMLHAEKVSVRPRFFPLFIGNLAPGKIKVQNATLYLPAEEEAGAQRTAPVAFRLINGRFEFDADTIRIPRLQGNVLGGQFSMEGNVRNWRSLSEPTSDEDPEEFFGWDSLLASMPATSYEYVGKIRDFAERQLFVREETFVRTTFDLDLADPEKNSAQGIFQITDLNIGALPVRTFKGQFTLDGTLLALPEFKMHAGLRSSMSGQLLINIKSLRLQGGLRGSFDPHLAYGLLGRPMPRWLAEARFPVPPAFDVKLHPSPLPPEKWRANGTFAARNMIYRATHVRSAQGRFERKH